MIRRAGIAGTALVAFALAFVVAAVASDGDPGGSAVSAAPNVQLGYVATLPDLAPDPVLRHERAQARRALRRARAQRARRRALAIRRAREIEAAAEQAAPGDAAPAPTAAPESVPVAPPVASPPVATPAPPPTAAPPPPPQTFDDSG